MSEEGGLPVASSETSAFTKINEGEERYYNFENDLNIRSFGAREFRFKTTDIIKSVDKNEWLVFTHYGEDKGAIVSKSDLDFLSLIGNATHISDLVEAFENWDRADVDAPFIHLLERVRSDQEFLEGLAAASDAKSLITVLREARSFGPTHPAVASLGAIVDEARRQAPALSDFAECVPSYDANGDVRSVQFGGGDHIKSGQLAIMETTEGRQYLHGFIERVQVGAAVVLELPNGQIIEQFDQDGSVLYLKRTLLDAPVALLDIRARLERPQEKPLLLG
jgi:hypothetical protein